MEIKNYQDVKGPVFQTLKKDLQKKMLTETERVLFSACLSIIIIVGGTANIFVLYVLYREKSLRRNIAIVFIINLIIIDLCNIIFVMPVSLAAVSSQRWRISEGLKDAASFVALMIELVSMLALAAISLDRLAAVMKPLAYRARMTVNKALQLNSYIWFQAIAFAFVPLLASWYIFNERYKSCTLISYSTKVGFYVYIVCLIGLNFVFSLVVILVTYFYIFRVARSHSKRIAHAVLPKSIFSMSKTKIRRESFRHREVRTACKILFVTGAFIVCHVPYAIIRIVELSRQRNHDSLPHTLTIASKWASYSKSSFDPFIYCLLQKRFRKAFMKLLFRKHNSTNLNRSLQSDRRSTRETNCEEAWFRYNSFTKTGSTYKSRSRSNSDKDNPPTACENKTVNRDSEC